MVSVLGGAAGVGSCWLVAVVLAVSAVGKLRTRAVRAGFRQSVADMAMLPARAVRPVAAAVPIVEAVAAGLLVVPPTAAIGCMLAVGLLTVFTAAIVVVLRRGTRASCLCFGTTERPYRPHHLVRNGLLTVAAVAGAVLSAHPTDAAAALIAIAAGTVIALVLVTSDELLDLFRTPSRR